MDARDLLLVLLLGGAAWWYARQSGALQGTDPVSNILAEGETLLSPIFNLPGAPTVVTQDKADTLAIVNALNASEFGGFFDPADVMAFIATESSFRPGAFLADRNGGSYGLMQVDYVAAQQVGYQGTPDGLFDPATGIQFGMAYLVWIWGYLSSHLGQAPTEMQWVTAYNAGVGNVVKGYADTRYYSTWRGYRDQWRGLLSGTASA
jgi:hypothetical protein